MDDSLNTVISERNGGYDNPGEHNIEEPLIDGEEGEIQGGLGVLKCAVFIVALMAGSGTLALPAAFAGTGWTGIVILTVVCLLTLYCGIILGKCWVLIRKKYPVNTSGHVRDPYPLIGHYAAGKVGKYIVEACIILNSFGTAVVYLLISSKQIASILNLPIGSFDDPSTEYRAWILICGGVLIPLTWFASPKEMSLVGYLASSCTIITCVLIVVRTSMKIYKDGRAPDSAIREVTLESFSSAFGTMVFAFGGAVLTPSIQADMKEPEKFAYSAVQGYLFIHLMLYLPVCILPYIAIGTDIDSNVLKTLKALPGDGSTMMAVAETLMTFHLLFATIIITNPVSQQIEEHFEIIHKFGWKRIAIRTTLMLLSIGTAEAYPNFGKILDIMGASTVSIMCFILPAFFYLRLQDPMLVPLHQKVFHVEIMVMAVVFGVISLYSSIHSP